MVKGSDRIADPFLTKGSGSDRRSRKKGSSNSLTKCKQTADGSNGTTEIIEPKNLIEKCNFCQKIFKRTKEYSQVCEGTLKYIMG